jgi:hypothetical protein
VNDVSGGCGRCAGAAMGDHVELIDASAHAAA